jgi:hypothetical protein
VEIIFAALIAPIMMVIQTGSVLGILFGRDTGWTPQRRDDGSIPLRDIVRRHRAHMALGLVTLVVALMISKSLAAWMSPTIAGLLLAIPLSWASGKLALGMAMRRMGLLEGVTVVRSSDPEVRRRACPVADCFVDVPHEGEIVRARHQDGRLRLHSGGDQFITLPEQAWERTQVSPSRDSRLVWMQSVIHCTHYVAGAGEQAYLHPEQTPEISFINRDVIDRSDEAWTEFPA